MILNIIQQFDIIQSLESSNLITTAFNKLMQIFFGKTKIKDPSAALHIQGTCWILYVYKKISFKLILFTFKPFSAINISEP